MHYQRERKGPEGRESDGAVELQTGEGIARLEKAVVVAVEEASEHSADCMFVDVEAGNEDKDHTHEAGAGSPDETGVEVDD